MLFCIDCLCVGPAVQAGTRAVRGSPLSTLDLGEPDGDSNSTSLSGFAEAVKAVISSNPACVGSFKEAWNGRKTAFAKEMEEKRTGHVTAVEEHAIATKVGIVRKDMNCSEASNVLYRELHAAQCHALVLLNLSNNALDDMALIIECLEQLPKLLILKLEDNKFTEVAHLAVALFGVDHHVDADATAVSGVDNPGGAAKKEGAAAASVTDSSKSTETAAGAAEVPTSKGDMLQRVPSGFEHTRICVDLVELWLAGNPIADDCVRMASLRKSGLLPSPPSLDAAAWCSLFLLMCTTQLMTSSHSKVCNAIDRTELTRRRDERREAKNKKNKKASPSPAGGGGGGGGDSAAGGTSNAVPQGGAPSTGEQEAPTPAVWDGPRTNCKDQLQKLIEYREELMDLWSFQVPKEKDQTDKYQVLKDLREDLVKVQIIAEREGEEALVVPAMHLLGRFEGGAPAEIEAVAAKVKGMMEDMLPKPVMLDLSLQQPEATETRLEYIKLFLRLYVQVPLSFCSVLPKHEVKVNAAVQNMYDVLCAPCIAVMRDEMLQTVENVVGSVHYQKDLRQWARKTFEEDWNIYETMMAKCRKAPDGGGASVTLTQRAFRSMIHTVFPQEQYISVDEVIVDGEVVDTKLTVDKKSEDGIFKSSTFHDCVQPTKNPLRLLLKARQGMKFFNSTVETIVKDVNKSVNAEWDTACEQASIARTGEEEERKKERIKLEVEYTKDVESKLGKPRKIWEDELKTLMKKKKKQRKSERIKECNEAIEQYKEAVKKADVDAKKKCRGRETKDPIKFDNTVLHLRPLFKAVKHVKAVKHGGKQKRKAAVHIAGTKGLFRMIEKSLVKKKGKTNVAATVAVDGAAAGGGGAAAAAAAGSDGDGAAAAILVDNGKQTESTTPCSIVPDGTQSLGACVSAGMQLHNSAMQANSVPDCHDIRDVYGCIIDCYSFAAMAKVVKYIGEFAEWEVLRVKNRLGKGFTSGQSKSPRSNRESAREH